MNITSNENASAGHPANPIAYPVQQDIDRDLWRTAPLTDVPATILCGGIKRSVEARPLFRLLDQTGSVITSIECDDPYPIEIQSGSTGTTIYVLLEIYPKPTVPGITKRSKINAAKISQILSKSELDRAREEYQLRYEDYRSSLAPSLRDLKVKADELQAREDQLNSEVEKRLKALSSDVEKKASLIQEKSNQIDQETELLHLREIALREIELKQEIFFKTGGPRFMRLLAGPELHNQSLPPKPQSLMPLGAIRKHLSIELARWGYRPADIGASAERQCLLAALAAATSGMFVVLAGPTGVGKTSFVSHLANALGAGAKVVPVRPGWIDPTDLLGFYDPQRKQFQPSSFTSNLADAHFYADAGRLYFLLLDEMNLSRIENYAADFLARLEKARGGDKDATISLYSRDLEMETRRMHKLPFADGHLPAPVTEVSDKDEPAISSAQALEWVNRFPAELGIPSSTVFIGTINPDETTHPLSPKFIDRSFVIKMKAPHTLITLDPVPHSGTPTLSPNCIDWKSLQRIAKEGVLKGKEYDEIKGALDSWLGVLDELEIGFGYRSLGALRAWLLIAEALGEEPFEAFDLFLLCKVLPRLSFHRDQKIMAGTKTKSEALDEWIRMIDATRYPMVRRELEALHKAGESLISYLG